MLEISSSLANQTFGKPRGRGKNGVGFYTHAVVPLTPERPYYTS
jgi:hypothetical protein